MMHNLDELKRQWDQAKSRLQQARDAESTAKRRYEVATCEKMRADLDAQGFTEGTKVRVVKNNFNDDVRRSEVVAVGPVQWDHFKPRLIFYKIKADGTPGKARARVSFYPQHDDFLELAEGE